MFECTSLIDLMARHGHDHIDLLKMDIEGFEYEVIDHIFEKQITLRQLCVEFHDRFRLGPKAHSSRSIRMLRELGFTLIHKHRADYTFCKL